MLDPACGSGNFLYVALQSLLDLELEVRTFAAREEINQPVQPRVGPHQLKGIEINTYAAELAHIVIWIGYLQWHRQHGDVLGRTPILERLDAIENRDAILAWADEHGNDIPVWREGAVCKGQAWWPQTDFIVGNPPFLGSKMLRKFGMPDPYIDAMYASYDLPNTSDLCCYWFDKAGSSVLKAPQSRVGLLATQGIRGQFNRPVLDKLAQHAQIFEVWSDRKWILDGAAVHVSIVMFTGDDEGPTRKDGVEVSQINPDLSAGPYLGAATQLKEMNRVAFMGDTKGGAFDLEWEHARRLLSAPNPNGKSTLEVTRPWINGEGTTRRSLGYWIVDFPADMSEETAAGFEHPFRLVKEVVKPERDKNRRASYKEKWWIHAEPRPAMRQAIGDRRYIATPNLTKYRFFVHFPAAVLPDHQLIAFARSDDYFFGVLHSSIHELWARRQGTQLREAESGFRYTPTTCFETFPLPWSPGSEPSGDPLHEAISTAASELDERRERWLNPPEWVKPIEEKIDRFDSFDDVAEVSGEEARRLIRQSAIDAACAADKRLKKRTLTNLYNERPAWLAMAHEKLDRAVIAAYASVDPDGDWDPDWAEVFKATGAGQPTTDEAEAAKREEIEQKILANLLRMNRERAAAEK
ncbi:MAG: DNA methyltransferase [Phycisphaerales bacterium]